MILLYGKDIYNDISGNTPVGEVCDAVHACHNATVTTVSLAAVIEEAVESNPGLPCLLCELVLERIDAADKNLTYLEFEADAKNVCAKFPSLSKECDGMRRFPT